MTLQAADGAFLERLKAVLPIAAFAADPAGFLTEPRGRWAGQGIVVSPADVTEVSVLLATCHAAGVPVVPILAERVWWAGRSSKIWSPLLCPWHG